MIFKNTPRIRIKMTNNLNKFLKELSDIHNVENFIGADDRYEIVFGSIPVTIFSVGEYVIFDCKIAEVVNDIDDISNDELLMWSIKEVKKRNVIFSLSNKSHIHCYVKLKANSRSDAYMNMLNSMLNSIENITNTYDSYKNN